jgi:hypothetical protein
LPIGLSPFPDPPPPSPDQFTLLRLSMLASCPCACWVRAHFTPHACLLTNRRVLSRPSKPNENSTQVSWFYTDLSVHSPPCVPCPTFRIVSSLLSTR